MLPQSLETVLERFWKRSLIVLVIFKYCKPLSRAIIALEREQTVPGVGPTKSGIATVLVINGPRRFRCVRVQDIILLQPRRY